MKIYSGVSHLAGIGEKMPSSPTWQVQVELTFRVPLLVPLVSILRLAIGSPCPFRASEYLMIQERSPKW